MRDEVKRRLESVRDRCIGCGVCTAMCDSVGRKGDTVGSFAADILERLESGATIEDLDAIAVHAVRSCSLCSNCVAHCPVGIDVTEVVLAAREFLNELDPFLAADYRFLRTDLKWNIFSLLREVNEISYADLMDATSCVEGDAAETMFFPGCTLATYAPELTREVYDWLVCQGIAAQFSDLCCGKTIDYMGLSTVHERYRNDLVAYLLERDVRRIIVSCPNCYYMLRSTIGAAGADIEVVALSQLILEQGLRCDSENLNPGTVFTVHDSCPDRFEMTFASEVRALAAGLHTVEMEHSGLDTICCGSGGLASSVDPSVCFARSSRRLAECNAAGAKCIVTSCVSCSNSFLRNSQDIDVRHYLELIFESQIDWGALRLGLKKLNEGAGASRADELLRSTESIFTKTGEGEK